MFSTPPSSLVSAATLLLLFTAFPPVPVRAQSSQTGRFESYIAQLRDPSFRQRVAALKGINSQLLRPTTEDAEALLPAVTVALTDDWWEVRYESAATIRILGPLAAAAEESLVRSLGISEGSEGVEVVRALGAIGPLKLESRQALLRALRERDAAFREPSARALIASGEAGVSALMEAVLAGPDPVTEAGLSALAGVGAGAKGAATGATQILESPATRDRSREYAISVIGNIGAPEGHIGVPELVRHLSLPALADRASTALLQLGDSGLVALLASYPNQQESARRGILTSAGRHPSVATLRLGLTDESAALRARAAEGFVDVASRALLAGGRGATQLREQLKCSLEQVRTLTRDSAEAVRASAYRAVSVIEQSTAAISCPSPSTP